MATAPRMLAAACAGLACATISWAAAPVFSEIETLESGLSVIPDANEAGVYYLVPERLRLRATDAGPAFFFYKAVRASGHEHLPGGVLQLTLEMPQPEASEIEALRGVKGADAALRPLQVERLDCELLLTRAGEEPASLAVSSAPWLERSLSFALDEAAATVLWDALERGESAAITASVTATSRGYVIRRAADGTWEYEPVEREDRFSVPVGISREQHPDRFQLVDLESKRSFRYRDLRVYCFDFVNGLLEGLLRVEVEIAIRTPRGQRERRLVTFEFGGGTSSDVEFRLPGSRKGSYEFRVHRYFEDKAPEAGAWTSSTEVPLDVTLYALETEIGDEEGELR